MTVLHLSTGIYESIPSVCVAEALHRLAPAGHPLPRKIGGEMWRLPEDVSPVLAAFAEGSARVGDARRLLDPDALLGALPALFGSRGDADAERERAEAVADDYLADGLPGLLRAMRGALAAFPDGGAVGGHFADRDAVAACLDRLERRLPLERADLVAEADDRLMLDLKKASHDLYRADPFGRVTGSLAFRCQAAVELLEDAVRALRAAENPEGYAALWPGEDPHDGWADRRRADIADLDGWRTARLARAASSLGAARALATVALRQLGEDAEFTAPALLERLAAPGRGPAPGM